MKKDKTKEKKEEEKEEPKITEDSEEIKITELKGEDKEEFLEDEKFLEDIRLESFDAALSMDRGIPSSLEDVASEFQIQKDVKEEDNVDYKSIGEKGGAVGYVSPTEYVSGSSFDNPAENMSMTNTARDFMTHEKGGTINQGPNYDPLPNTLEDSKTTDFEKASKSDFERLKDDPMYKIG